MCMLFVAELSVTDDDDDWWESPVKQHWSNDPTRWVKVESNIWKKK